MLTYAELVSRFGSDDDYSLLSIARVVKETAGDSWHIDRHVLEVDEEARVVDAILAAVALARAWMKEREGIGDLVVSVPYVIVDSEWVHRREPRTPPHVYVSMARSKDSFEPVVHSDLVPASFGLADVDAALHGVGTVWRTPLYDGEHAWIITL